MDFNAFWTRYNPDVEFCNRRAACERLWVEISELKRSAIISWLEKNRPPKGRNPYFFIQDFTVREASEEPTNYNGHRLPAEPTGTAFYKGKWGTFTIRDIEKYGLKRPDGQ